jgi:hypothetical protein
VTIQPPSYNSDLPQLTQKVSQIVSEHNRLERYVYGLYLSPQDIVAATPFQVQPNANIVQVDTSSIAITLNLPPINDMINRRLIIVDAVGNASVNNITIDADGSEQINGSSTRVINTNYGSVTLWNNGIKWLVI